MDLQRASEVHPDAELELRRHRGRRRAVGRAASSRRAVERSGPCGSTASASSTPTASARCAASTLALGARRARRGDRPVGRRQDDAGARPRHVAPAERGPRRRSTAATRGGSARARAAPAARAHRRRPPERRRSRRGCASSPPCSPAGSARGRRGRRSPRCSYPATPPARATALARLDLGDRALRPLRPALRRPAAARRHRPRALPAARRCILADEPVSALDPDARRPGVGALVDAERGDAARRWSRRCTRSTWR